LVRTTAELFVNPEEIALILDGCGGINLAVWIDLEGPIDAGLSRREKRQLHKLLRKDSRVVATVIGVFRGPRAVAENPALSPGGNELVRRVNSRYGHMNSFRFQLELQRIESFSAVRAD
jgi:hypothetical protein